VKLLALEDMVAVLRPTTIILASGDNVLAHAFSLWCRNAGMTFKWRRLKRRESPVSPAKWLYRSLPHPVQALLSLLRYLMQRWPLRQVGTKALSKSAGRLTFLSYFDNLDMEAARQGRFFSRYWTTLAEALAQTRTPTNWLQLYVPDESIRTAYCARNLVTGFNQTGQNSQAHSILDGVLGWSAITGTVRDYFRIVLAGLHLRKAPRNFRPANSNVDLWPLFRQDWRSSMYGSIAVSNCLFLNLLERTLVRMPRQDLGAYLQENQGWEMALVHAWKSAGHGTLVGVPHTCVNFWDLRFFVDTRAYRRTGKNDLPLPDMFALNGPAAIAACREGGFEDDRIVEVEALRYLYMANLPAAKGHATEQSNVGLRVLVLGDYMDSVTRQQMRWLVAASPALPADTRFVVRPHPNCPVEARDYPTLKMEIRRNQLAELLQDSDIAYTSNVTSAAVDAYRMGIPVVSVLDGDAFNLSPLRGLAEGVRFVTSPEELADALSSKGKPAPGFKKAEYFTIDPSLPRWKALLSPVTHEQVI
jgi:surface carbohydrate biosynthesis protein (TIGR04326 family)